MGEPSCRRVLIGDVHGHYQGLMTLLETIAPGQSDQIYFLGDLVDRGPESFQVVEFVRKSGYQCLLGNHEQLMLNAFPDGRTRQSALFSWFCCGGQDTLTSYHDQETSAFLDHVTWMKSLPFYIDLGDIWLVHAGVDPQLSLQEQTINEFCWIRNQFHRATEPYFPDKLIITGHTITFTLPGIKPGDLAQGAGWLNIDTGAYHPKSGWMTALDWTQQLVYQVNVFQQKVRVRSLAESVMQINLQDLK